MHGVAREAVPALRETVGHYVGASGMNTLLWTVSPFAVLGGMQVAHVAWFGEAAYPSTAHRTRQGAVIAARTTVVWVALVLLYAWLRT